MNKCPECGGKLISNVEGHGLSIKCEKCDYSIASSYFEEWEKDPTQYTVFIKPNENLKIESLKYISKKCQTSIIKIKQELVSKRLFFIKGLAYELKDDIIKLRELNIDYEIEPKFNYNFQ